MKKHIALYAIVAAALIAAPTLVRAQDSSANKPAATESGAPAKKHVVPFYGKVSAVDATAMTVTIAKRTFTVTSETKIMKEDKPATFADIKVGEKIGGQYKKDAAGKLNATVIHIGGKVGKAQHKKTTAATDNN